MADLSLKKLLQENFRDSLISKGWMIDLDDQQKIIISKVLQAADNLDNPAIRINVNVFSGGNPIPVTTNSIGINNFRKQQPFQVKDSVVTFVLKGNPNAKQVLLAGNFSNWQQGALAMNKTAEGWELPVKLNPGKYWYKYIVDGNWMPDPANALLESDDEGNNNSVFYVSNHTFRLDGYTDAKKVYLAGSFANWEAGKELMKKTAAGWELPVFLNTGTYTYRYIVDNNWITDPGNKDKLPNEFDDYNSVVSIGKPIIFSLTGLPDAKKVYLAGSFNQWRPFELSMTKTATGWELPYVLGAGNYEYKFYVDGQAVDAEGNIVSNVEPGSVFVIEPNYTFRLKGNAGARTVYLAGDFNNWSPNGFPMKKDGDDWVMTVHLSPGKHLYKFVVDGQWIIDPSNELWEENEHGTGNSIVWLQ
ncbi:MAG: hypothetical protein QM687_09415 [Ferruginibacter sp.]